MSASGDVSFLENARPVPDMSALELAMIIAMYRKPALDLTEVAFRMSDWFKVDVTVPDLNTPLRRLITREWLTIDGVNYCPTDTGLSAARRLLGGMIRMIDGGRRLFDVGMMMQLTSLKENQDETGH